MEKRRMCPQCRAFITTDDKICPYCQTEVAPPAIQRRAPADIMGGLIPHARFTTMMILLINTGLFIASVLHNSGSTAGFDPDFQSLIDFGAKDPPRIFFAGEWWRLITAGYLHGGIMHILMNSWVLFDLGVQIEESFGTSRYLFIYSFSNVTGFLLSSYWYPRTLSIGASAAIFGLIGAMIAMGVRDRSSYGAAVRSVYIRWAFYGLLMGLLPFFATDNAAHVGGLAGGFVAGFVCGTPGRSQAVEGIWKTAAGVAIAATVFAFVKMFLSLTAAH